MKKKLFGERLLETGLINQRQLAQALQAQQSTGEQLGRLLVRLGYVSEEQLLRMLCEDAGVPFTDLSEVEPDPAALATIPEQLARSSLIFPIRIENGRLVVALADPFNVATLASVERSSGRPTIAVGAPGDRLRAALDGAFSSRSRNGGDRQAGLVSDAASDGAFSGRRATDGASDEALQTASTIADAVFKEAVSLGATDIHVEPGTEQVFIRYRLDGILRAGPTFPKAIQAPLLTRIKVLAGLNIAESRLPQDGRLRINTGGRHVDLRVSTFPTVNGEDMVLRVLDRSRVALDLTKLGMDPDDRGLFHEILARPSGLLLITGPTGSGKTTTLYAALSHLNTGERCILTLEDPVEYEVKGIRQSQINPRAGLTFASGLRSMLRHDPDIILVGEIRDLETAEIAMSAAMTGHGVLSTLHTNSAAAAIPRLLDMGVEPYALASSLQLSVAQRLLRLVCDRCREPTDVPVAVRRRFDLIDVPIFRARGCSVCHQTGYRGRIAIFELLPSSDELAAAIHARAPAEEIQRIGQARTLLQAGLEKVREGATTLEELLRVVSL